MKKLQFLLLLLFVLQTSITLAQKINNITYRQEQSNIIVSYDLETKTPCKINLFVSTNGGTTWQGPLIKVTGDVGAKLVSGSHSITWNVLEEFEELRGDKIQFQVQADGDTIETVVIGNQEWTTKNLDVSKYRNGDIIPEVKDPREWAALTSGAWCYYNNDSKNGAIYGKLYNWYAVNDRRGLSPEGFRIPTDSKLNWLTNKEKPAGFSGHPGGYRSYDGKFSGIGEDSTWWSSSEGTKVTAWNRTLNYNYGTANLTSNSKTYGFSVRCLKD